MLLDVLEKDGGYGEGEGGSGVDVELPCVAELEDGSDGDPDADAGPVEHECPEGTEGEGDDVTGFVPGGSDL